MNWTQQIVDCFENENHRHLLKGIPLRLIAAAAYEPDFIYWDGFLKANRN